MGKGCTFYFDLHNLDFLPNRHEANDRRDDAEDDGQDEFCCHCAMRSTVVALLMVILLMVVLLMVVLLMVVFLLIL